MIGVLEEERWPELREIFEKDWDSGLPNKGRANIIAEFDEDGNIRSFVVAEMVMRIGQIHSENGAPRKLFRWLEEHMPRDNTVIVVADEPRFEKLCELLKMRPLVEERVQVFRRDF
jgi:hypothetical protein